MSEKRVVITGMGWITSLGNDLNGVFDLMLNGTSGIKPIDRYDLTGYDVTFGGQIDWDGAPYLDSRDRRKMDRFVQYAIGATGNALIDANLDPESVDKDRVGVIYGSGIGGIEEFQDGHARLMTKGPKRVSPMMIPKLMINAAPAGIAIKWGFRGPNYACVTACASAGHALADAYECIRRGDADVIISGGSESSLSGLGIACFATMRALSTRNDAPTKASRPFDKDRDGFVMAEGGGTLILEDYEYAKARGARIYAEIVGWGASCDAGHITAPDPNGKGAQAAMKGALTRGNVPAEKIGHINTHATSTPLGDMAEARAIRGVFGDHALKIAINSTKSMTGHLLGASGGIEGIACVKALTTGDVPPTINLENPEEEVADLNLVPNEAQVHPNMEYTMSNSFGFGGHNVSLVFKKV